MGMGLIPMDQLHPHPSNWGQQHSHPSCIPMDHQLPYPISSHPSMCSDQAALGGTSVPLVLSLPAQGYSLLPAHLLAPAWLWCCMLGGLLMPCRMGSCYLGCTSLHRPCPAECKG